MGSDLQPSFSEENIKKSLIPADPLFQGAYDQGGEEGIQTLLDPLDIFGQRGKEDVRIGGEAAKLRILQMVQSANRMRGRILTDIKERDLKASEAAAGKRRELSRRSGRSSTILTR